MDGKLLRKYSAWIAAVLAIVAVVGVLVFVVFGRFRPIGPVAPIAAAAPAPVAVPGDAYIQKTVRDYLVAVTDEESQTVERLSDGVVDPATVRSETLGRFASASPKAFDIRSVHDEQAFSGDGSGKPATSWSAFATVGVTMKGGLETLEIGLTGTYSSNGVVESSKAVSAVP